MIAWFTRRLRKNEAAADVSDESKLFRQFHWFDGPMGGPLDPTDDEVRKTHLEKELEEARAAEDAATTRAAKLERELGVAKANLATARELVTMLKLQAEETEKLVRKEQANWDQEMLVKVARIEELEAELREAVNAAVALRESASARQEIEKGWYVELNEALGGSRAKTVVARVLEIRRERDALRAAGVQALDQLEEIRTDRLAACGLTREANAVSAARVALDRAVEGRGSKVEGQEGGASRDGEKRYRALEPGEVLQEGDEWLKFGSWKRVDRGDAGRRVSMEGAHCRRPVRMDAGVSVGGKPQPYDTIP